MGLEQQPETGGVDQVGVGIPLILDAHQQRLDALSAAFFDGRPLSTPVP
jgi:hypothetical protein